MAIRRGTSKPKIGASGIEAVVESHDRALYGVIDRDNPFKSEPGLIDRIDQAHRDITEIKTDITAVKVALTGVPELVSSAQHIKRWGAYGTGAIIALLLAVVFHQYNLIPAFLNALGK